MKKIKDRTFVCRCGCVYVAVIGEYWNYGDFIYCYCPRCRERNVSYE